MSNMIASAAALSDSDLLVEINRLTGCERQATARLVAALGELDGRRLYLGEGCSSLFSYCTQVLHLSEHAAYGRIEAARAARKWPIMIELLADGSLHLTAITLLAPHLSDDNHRSVLAAARHKSKRQIEELVAALRPRPAVPSTVRKLPAPQPPPPAEIHRNTSSSVDVEAAAAPHWLSVPAAAMVPTPAARRAEIKPLAPECYKVQFTVSREVHDQLREVQDLLRHRIPTGDVAAIFECALTALLADLRKARHAKTDRPRGRQTTSSKGRHVPASVRRAVWQRDGGRCAFQGSSGRCTERGCLEYHHVVPFADGGATTADNLELRCRAHNAFEAERWFGASEEDVVREARASYGEVPALRPD